MKEGFSAPSPHAAPGAGRQPAAPFGAAPQHAPLQAALGWLGSLLYRLEVMNRVLAVDADADFAELCLSSRSAPAVCVFRRSPLRTGQVQALFRALQPPRAVEDFFWVALARTPAERHAVRVSLDGRLSVFFKTDVPTAHIAHIARAVDLGEHAAPAARYFEETGRTASGIAWELGDAGWPRLRLYDNVTGFPDFAKAAALSPLLPRNCLDTLRELSGDQAAEPSVLNFSATREGLSVKIEAPGVSLNGARRANHDAGERALFAAARAIMSRCGMARANYFGLRFRDGDRELSCYLDGLRTASRKR